MRRMHNLRARTKFFIAYALFVLPVAFLLYVIVDKSNTDSAFAQKERVGTSYVMALRSVHDALLQGDAGTTGARLAGQVATAEQDFGADMGSAELAKAAVAALNASADPMHQAARAALRDLMAKVTDGSNLTLDPDLDSFYVMDATTGKIPDALDRFYDIAALTAGFAGKAALAPGEQAEFLVQAGNLPPVLDGLETSLTTAFKANDKVDQALGNTFKTTQQAGKQALATLRTLALDNRADAAQALPAIRPVLTALAALDARSAVELDRLLGVRIAGFRNGLLLDLSIAAAFFAVAVGFGLVVIQTGVVGQLGRITELMRRLAAGDLEVVVPLSGRRDEIGEMIEAIEVFKRQALENQRMTRTKAIEQAAQDARRAAIDRHTQDFGSSVSGVMASLGQSASKMHAAAVEMSAAAEQTRGSTSGSVDRIGASARDLNSVAVAAEQMAASVHEISRQVSHVTTAVGTAVDRAADTDTKVGGLADAADQIGDVVRLITDIAGQTNLLALNATIEAARAGDAGKGFAVVASEVKTLATQTARATEQIGAQIVAIRTSTAEAVSAVRDVGLAIAQVSEVATAIAAAVEQQAAATQEISASVQTVTNETNAAAEAMEEVLTIAEQTDIASQSVLAAADDVGATADTLQTEVNDFLTAMKRGEGDDRRSFERIKGDGMTAMLQVGGSAAVQAAVRDISRGGIALLSSLGGTAGTEVKVALPGDATVSGRIVRAVDGVVSIAFRQDAASLARVDGVLAALQRGNRRAAA